MKKITERMLAIFLAFVMCLDMVMPVWATEINELDDLTNATIIECGEDDCDCCDHEHHHDEELVSEGLIKEEVINPEEKVEVEPEEEKEEKGFFEKVGEGITNTFNEVKAEVKADVESIKAVFTKQEAKVEEPEEVESEVNEEEEIEIIDNEIPLLSASVMAASRTNLLETPTKDTSWAVDKKDSKGHTVHPNLNDCTAKVTCVNGGTGNKHTVQWFTAHEFPEGTCGETVECIRCNQTKTYEHVYTNSFEPDTDTQHLKYCDICKKAVKENHRFGQAQKYDCTKHKLVCQDCGYVKYVEHTMVNKGGGYNAYQQCSVCGAKTNDSNFHNYVFDVNGTITYSQHTLKCTGCGATKLENHDLESAYYDNGFFGIGAHWVVPEPGECSVCSVHQYCNELSSGSYATHRFIVNNSDCTQDVYCLATLSEPGSDDYCSEPDKTFNRGSHEYVYSNQTKTTHDKSCEYCTINEITEPHVYDQKGGTECICGYKKPACEHTWRYEKYNETQHKYICSKDCGADGYEAHTWDNGTITTEPTCTEDGVKTYTCKCGETKTETVSRLGHEIRHDNKVEATCTEKGYTAGDYCTRCEKYINGHEEIAPKGHDVKTDAAKDADCTHTGLTEGSHCERCHEVLVAQVETKALGHDYDSVVTDPTCTKGGYTTHTCSRCKDSYTDNETNALGHLHEDANWEEVKTATCTEKGKEKNLCSRCKEEDIIYRDIDELGHDYDSVVTVPTCTKGGYTTHTCSRCQDSYTDNETNALGHAWDNGIQTIDPTCTEKGNMHYECTRCEATKDEDVAALGHLHRTVEKEDATCTEDGYTEGDYCDRCQTYTSGHEKIKAKGHKVSTLEKILATCLGWGKTEGEKCSVCGAILKAQEDVEPLGHKWGDWKVTTEPTCTEAGVETRVCARDRRHTETRPVEATGHDYQAVVTQPTCTEQGYTTHTCSKCNDSYVDTYVNSTGHNLVEDTSVASTYEETENGHIRHYTMKCTNEGCAYTEPASETLEHNFVHVTNSDKYLPVENNKATHKHTWEEKCVQCEKVITKEGYLAHNWDDEQVVDPTCTEDGYTLHHCRTCGFEYKDEIKEALGHNHPEDSYNVVTEPSCEEDGLAESYCTRCKEDKHTKPVKATGHNMEHVEGSDTYTYNENASEGTHEHIHTWKEKCTNINCTHEEEKHETLNCVETQPVVENQVESKCNAQGSYDLVVYCRDCKKELNRTTVPVAKLPHTNGEKVTENVIAPTCTQDGSHDEVVYCTVCNEEVSRVNVIDKALGHKPNKPVTENFKDSTCTEEGSYDEVVYCETCKAELSRTPKTIEMKAHTKQIVMGKLATCLVDGYTSYEECAVCHTHLTEPRKLKALGHDFEHGKEVERVDSTCEEDGHYTMKCIRCQETHEYPIAAKGHTEVPMMTKMETCTEPGEQGGVKCSVCNKVLVEPTVIPAHDHDYGEWVVTVDPTCTTKGTKVKTCKWDTRHTITEDVAKLPHTNGETVIENEVAPTCTQDGSHDEVVYCTECGNELSRTPVVDKAHGHKYGDWVETKAPKCKEDGEKIRVCEYDETHIETEAIPAIGHKWIAAEKPDSYKDNGETHTRISWKQCENCGSLLQKTTQYLSHTYGDWITTKEATCVSEGLKERTCICGHVDTEVIPVDKDAHAYGQWYRWIEPKCEEFGYMRRDCANSDAHYETKAIGMLGHDKENATWQVKTKAGNETEGLEVLICGRDNCDKELEARTIKERNITVSPKTVTFNGENQVGAIVPNEGGYSVEVLKGNDKVNEAVNAGEYKLVFTFPENEKYNQIKVEAVLTISPAKITPDDVKFAEELQALMNKNIDRDYDGTNKVLFDGKDEMIINLDGVDVKVTGTFDSKLPGENKPAMINLAIQDENGNYVFANNETEMQLRKEGSINVIKLADTFGDVNLANNVTDKKEISKAIDKNLDKSDKDIKAYGFNDMKIADYEYDIPELKTYGTKEPATVTIKGIIKDDEGNDIVIIEKKVTGTITYNKSSKKRNKKKRDEIQIEDQDVALGLDFEYIDLPKNEVTPSDWAKDDIYDLTYQGIVNGYEDLTYRPNNRIRRDEFSKLAYLILGLKEDPNGRAKDFEDTVDNWAKDMIREATTVDVLRGYDDRFFGPADNITNEQMMAILVRGLRYLGEDVKITDDAEADKELAKVIDGAEVSDWAKLDAATAVKYGLFQGDENKAIKPLGYTTRAQVAVIIKRYQKVIADLVK